jgi:transcriptional regulator with XRE-family HTH domain
VGDDTPFAQWLSVTMQRRGLSQAEVAREVGVADAQISRWKRGQVTPSVRYLHRIAETFHVPRAHLEQMAGYPVWEAEEQIDPSLTAEIEAHQARLRQVLEERLPPELWQSYMAACEALAERLSESFTEAAENVEQTHRRGTVGFRTE